MDKYQELISSRIVSWMIGGSSFLLKVIKIFLIIFWIGITLGIIYFYWSGMMPKNLRGTSSSSGIEISVRITGTHGWSPAYETTLTLTAPSQERFVYYLDTLGSQDAVEQWIKSMVWENDSTLSFENHLKNKRVIIAYDKGFWTLTEQSLPLEF